MLSFTVAVTKYILRSGRQSKNKLAIVSLAENSLLEHETKDDTELRAK